MNNAEALEYARAAMLHWGVDHTPRLIKNRENAVFESIAPDGAKAALRLHRPGYQSDNSIRSELWWAEALVAAGLNVPLPFRTADGDVLAEVPEAGRMASLVSWSNGDPMGEGDVPLAGSAEQQERNHYLLGQELARLHIASDAAILPENFERPVLDIAALVGEDPAWGRFWENPSLTTQEAELLLRARARLQQQLKNFEPSVGDFGLIHADALRENVMVHDGTITLIDFDDGVFGFRMYELGVAMSQNWDQPNQGALGRALLAGYGSVRKLPEDADMWLETFMVMRGLASCGWVIGRYSDSDPVVRSYAQRAIELAQRWA